MLAPTLDQTSAPSIEVRIYRDFELLVRETCHTGEEAAVVAAQAADLDHVYLLVDDAVPNTGPGDVFLREDPVLDSEQDQPLALQQLSGYGVE